eukprot:CAMPEP_0179191424 /NCGR_PEP_ID=MMETSP0796-20121207/95081_1 /TAXON_ID=73915 /ORGANISM="Pyrodinium bahamense, Strain pbaha01" /LENGTH=239 /DNA_ID=CAMNT_0020895651 /DNA_START=45 /DNA_END=764 /DNA_ORIENTATION=-
MGNGSSGRACRNGKSHCEEPHEVQLAATEILRVAGMSGYHTSVIVDDREYFFDYLGIMVAPPLWSHIAGQMKRPSEIFTEVIPIGRSVSSGKALVQALCPHFEKGSYDIFCKNCNTFTDTALYFLTRSRLCGRYNRIERLVTATDPISTRLINRLFRNPGEAGGPWTDFYVPNPEAAGFSVDEVLASFDESDSESSASDESSGSDDGRTCSFARHACYGRRSRVARPVRQEAQQVLHGA